MQRQRGELVPIGEAVAAFTGSALALGPPQRGFTVADQVHQLVGASEEDPDRGFMARTMALCSLPRSNPGNRLQYKRVNGPYTLYMTVTGSNKLPYGKGESRIVGISGHGERQERHRESCRTSPHDGGA